MSKQILQNIPEAETLLEMETGELAGYVLEHLHSVGGNPLSQGNSLPHNLANSLGPRYHRHQDRVYKAIVAASHWLINNGYLDIINGQGFYEISKTGDKFKTIAEFKAHLSQNTTGDSSTNKIRTLELFLRELDEIKTSLSQEGYSKMGQRFERWKNRCVRFIRENLSEEEARTLSRYEMLDSATPQIAQVRRNHTIRVFGECRAFLEVLLDEIKTYGEDQFHPALPANEGDIDESTPTSAPLTHVTKPVGTQGSGGKNVSATAQVTYTHANDLYNKVKTLRDIKPLAENTARIIVESSDDAIREFGNTNQDKKVELRRWKAQAELALPPGTVEELRKRAEGEALKKWYPRNAKKRSVLFAVILLLLAGGAIAGLIRFFPAGSIRWFAKSPPQPSPSYDPSARTPSPTPKSSPPAGSASKTATAADPPKANVRIFIKATDFVQGVKILKARESKSELEAYGDVVMNAPPFDIGGNTLVYRVDSTRAGSYALYVTYASLEKRPMKIFANGEVANDSGLELTTNGYAYKFQRKTYQGKVRLNAGSNTLTLLCAAPLTMPHISSLELVPID